MKIFLLFITFLLIFQNIALSLPYQNNSGPDAKINLQGSSNKKMENSFKTLKNGKVANNVWANISTKEIFPANKNSFGYNMVQVIGDVFYEKYGKNLKYNQGKSDYTKFYHSAKSMNEIGFVLVKRGDSKLW